MQHIDVCDENENIGVHPLRGDDNASRGDIRRKWRNEAVVPKAPPSPPVYFSIEPCRDYFRLFIAQCHGDECELTLICPRALFEYFV